MPVLGCYHDRLLRAAELFGEHYLVGSDPARHNVTTPLISSLSGGADLARLETGRLWASYLVACAEAIPCLQRLAKCSAVGKVRIGISLPVADKTPPDVVGARRLLVGTRVGRTYSERRVESGGLPDATLNEKANGSPFERKGIDR